VDVVVVATIVKMTTTFLRKMSIFCDVIHVSEDILVFRSTFFAVILLLLSLFGKLEVVNFINIL